jgi:glycosylphosphatidylinositol transamidase (GPIT) subunit GPI8
MFHKKKRERGRECNDKLGEIRIALVPCSIDGCAVDVMFQKIQSPALVRVVSSSDIKVSCLLIAFKKEKLFESKCSVIMYFTFYIASLKTVTIISIFFFHNSSFTMQTKGRKPYGS